MAAIEVEISSPASECAITNAIGFLGTMARRKTDLISADLLIAAWVQSLTDMEMVGPIPDWVIGETARAFVCGTAGSGFMPSIAEFIAEAKRRLVPHRAALIEMRNILNAPVRALLTEQQRVDMKSRVDELLAGWGKPADKGGADRE